MRIGSTLTLAAAVLGLAACGGSMTISGPSTQLPSLQDVSEAQWSALSRRRIFFGHQSVGGNIMQGVTEVMAVHPSIKLNVVESRSFSGASPVFQHAAVGRNDYPLEKFDDFLALASQGFGKDDGVAMVKLCYTDAHLTTDAEVLFNDYQKRIAELRARNPSLTIVHFTMPLTVVENWKGRLVAFVRRTASQRERNVVRNQYNDLIRRAYEGREPLFDIARLESTLPDGRRVVYASRGDTVPMLAHEYTDDGGHLNASARRRVAEQFLIMLARLEPAVTAVQASTGSR